MPITRVTRLLARRARAQRMVRGVQGVEAYIVEVGIGEGWNTDVLRLGTTWKMLLNEQQR